MEGSRRSFCAGGAGGLAAPSRRRTIAGSTSEPLLGGGVRGGGVESVWERRGEGDFRAAARITGGRCGLPTLQASPTAASGPRHLSEQEAIDPSTLPVLSPLKGAWRLGTSVVKVDVPSLGRSDGSPQPPPPPPAQAPSASGPAARRRSVAAAFQSAEFSFLDADRAAERSLTRASWCGGQEAAAAAEWRRRHMTPPATQAAQARKRRDPSLGSAPMDPPAPSGSPAAVGSPYELPFLVYAGPSPPSRQSAASKKDGAGFKGVEPLARALIDKCGSLERAFASLDCNHKKKVTRTQFETGLLILRLDCLELCGISGKKLFKMMDTMDGPGSGTGDVSLENWSRFFEQLRGTSAANLLDEDLGKWGGRSMRPRRNSMIDISWPDGAEPGLNVQATIDTGLTSPGFGHGRRRSAPSLLSPAAPCSSRPSPSRAGPRGDLSARSSASLSSSTSSGSSRRLQPLRPRRSLSDASSLGDDGSWDNGAAAVVEEALFGLGEDARTELDAGLPPLDGRRPGSGSSIRSAGHPEVVDLDCAEKDHEALQRGLQGDVDLQALAVDDIDAIAEQQQLEEELKELDLTGIEALAYVFAAKCGSYKKAFKWFDSNRKGSFPQVVWETGIMLMKVDVERLTGFRTSQIFAMIDGYDGHQRDGLITKAEFHGFFSAVAHGTFQHHLRAAGGGDGRGTLPERAAAKKAQLLSERDRRFSKDSHLSSRPLCSRESTCSRHSGDRSLAPSRTPSRRSSRSERGAAGDAGRVASRGRGSSSRGSAASAWEVLDGTAPADGGSGAGTLAGEDLAEEEGDFQARIRRQLQALGPDEGLEFSEELASWQLAIIEEVSHEEGIWCSVAMGCYAANCQGFANDLRERLLGIEDGDSLALPDVALDAHRKVVYLLAAELGLVANEDAERIITVFNVSKVCEEEIADPSLEEAEQVDGPSVPEDAAAGEADEDGAGRAVREICPGLSDVGEVVEKEIVIAQTRHHSKESVASTVKEDLTEAQEGGVQTTATLLTRLFDKYATGNHRGEKIFLRFPDLKQFAADAKGLAPEVKRMFYQFEGVLEATFEDTIQTQYDMGTRTTKGLTLQWFSVFVQKAMTRLGMQIVSLLMALLKNKT